MKFQTNKYSKILAAAILTLSIAISIFASGGVLNVHASASAYSDVMADLYKDGKFTVEDYPANDKDYSIQIFQIAESTDGELFVYVYQPAANARKLTATNINMSLSEEFSNVDTSYVVVGNEFVSGNGTGNGTGNGSGNGSGFIDGTYDGSVVGGGHGGGGSGGRSNTNAGAGATQLYSLTLLSRQGVFSKYKVDGFTVSEDTTRYYNISTIYREFDYAIDDEADKDNTISKVAFKVGQLWTLTTMPYGVKYEVKEIEVVALTSQMIGIHRYYDGFYFDGTKSLDSHYIAFNCDHKIDKLLSADIEFDTRAYKTLAGSGTTYGDLVHHSVSLYGYQTASNDGGGWFGNKEEWHRMTSVNEFIKEVDLTDDEVRMLSDYDWILNFYESEFVNEAGGKDVLISGLLPFGFIWTIINACTTTGELVFDVSLLRLEFDYNGQIYNLGVVSNIQTGTNKPLNPPTSQKSGCAYESPLPWWAWVLIITFAPLAVALLYIAITLIFRAIIRREPAERNRRTNKKKSAGKKK